MIYWVATSPAANLFEINCMLCFGESPLTKSFLLVILVHPLSQVGADDSEHQNFQVAVLVDVGIQSCNHVSKGLEITS